MIPLAHELMEQAIEETKEHLEAMAAVDVEEARQLLSHNYRNAVRRWLRTEGRFVFRGTTSDIEVLSHPRPLPYRLSRLRSTSILSFEIHRLNCVERYSYVTDRTAGGKM